MITSLYREKYFMNKELEVKCIEDLFKDRQFLIKSLTTCLGNIETPSTFCINADWGYGKTTFLKILGEELTKTEYLVLSYNAWENDYEDDPFNSLYREIISEISNKLKAKKMLDQALEKALAGIAAAGIGFLKTAYPILYSSGKEVIHSLQNNGKENPQIK